MEIRPYGFKRSYMLNIWMKGYKSNHSQKVLSIVAEDGVQKVRERQIYFVDDSSLQIIQSIPLEEFTTYFRNGQNVDATDKKREKTFWQVDI